MLVRTISFAIFFTLVCLGVSACTTAGNSGGMTHAAPSAPSGGGY